jgi:hypothetical protein
MHRLTKSGQPATSSLHLVGSFIDSRNKVQQPLSAGNTCLFRLSHTTFGFVVKMKLHGDKSPTPSGIAVNACRNFATIVSNCLNGIPLLPQTAAFIHPCNIVSNFSRLASSSHNVLATPSQIQGLFSM